MKRTAFSITWNDIDSLKSTSHPFVRCSKLVEKKPYIPVLQNNVTFHGTSIMTYFNTVNVQSFVTAI